MIILYSKVDGEILMTTTSNRAIADMPAIDAATEGYISYVPDDDDPQAVLELNYIDLTTLMPTDKVPVTTTTTATTTVSVPSVITGLPECTATFSDGSSVNITDGELSISVDLAGEQEIEFTSPVSLPTTFTLTVTD
jgi:hypothetical protein